MLGSTIVLARQRRSSASAEKELLHDLSKAQHIRYRETGKWIVAQSDEDFAQLEKIHDFLRTVGAPTRFLSVEEGRRLEPAIQAKAGISESPTTRIIDSHILMKFPIRRL